MQGSGLAKNLVLKMLAGIAPRGDSLEMCGFGV